jgi:integrase
VGVVRYQNSSQPRDGLRGRQHVRRGACPAGVERQGHLDGEHAGVGVVHDVADQHLHRLRRTQQAGVLRQILLDGPPDAVRGRLRCRGLEDGHAADLEVAEPVELPAPHRALQPQDDLAPTALRDIIRPVRSEISELRVDDGRRAAPACRLRDRRGGRTRIVPVSPKLRGDRRTRDRHDGQHGGDKRLHRPIRSIRSTAVNVCSLTGRRLSRSG